MSSRSENAVSAFNQGFNCCQSVVAAYADLFGLSADDANRIAAGSGGGMGRLQEVCGAVTGAFMLAGLRHGSLRGNDGAAKEKTYAAVREIAARFKERNKTVQCRELLGCNLLTPEGVEHFKNKDLHHTLCARFVKEATEIVEELLTNEPQKDTCHF
ncbi:MAG: C-GCAxxG-C-C family protein [Fibrobacterota bacterium]